jgi:two-component system chemotaxis response regulator CheB
MTATDVRKRDTVVLGASAGGIEALQRVLPAFRDGTEASVFIVLHLPADGHSVLDSVLGRSTTFETLFARDGEAIVPRRVYVAPPDQHLLLEEGHVRLLHGARENRSRPAIDPLFRSAAAARRGRVMGAVLSGLLDDGAAGLLSVKRCGGLAFVQNPADAIESEMPERAVDVLGAHLDGALTADELGQHLVSLIGTPAPDGEVPEDVQLELRMLRGEVAGLEVLPQLGPPIPVSCPECGGPLWAISDGRLQRFRCHTGHTYGVESLLTDQSNQIERALWAAIKGLEQRSQMLVNLAKEVGQNRRSPGAERYKEEGARLLEHAQTLRGVLLSSFRQTRTG